MRQAYLFTNFCMAVYRLLPLLINSGVTVSDQHKKIPPNAKSGLERSADYYSSAKEQYTKYTVFFLVGLSNAP